jgi:hypothetical protein
MTILTNIGCTDVGRVLTRRIDAIVARRAVAGYRTVIELGIAPRVGVVTIFAVVATCDMGC